MQQNANAPKKRKSQSSKEAEEEELPLHYYEEEEQEAKKAKKQTKRGTQGREHDDVDRVPSRHEPLSKKVIKNLVNHNVVPQSSHGDRHQINNRINTLLHYSKLPKLDKLEVGVEPVLQLG